MLKVISFNLRCANDANGNSIDERAPRLKKILAQYNGDLYGFQESVPRWMEHLEEDYGEEYEIFNHYRGAKSLEGTPIMWRKSRFDCLDKGYFWLSDTPDIESKGWDTWGCNRICLWAKLLDKKDGNTILFFNTHYGFGGSFQAASSKLILAHIRAMGVEAAIITGDFNMHIGSPGYKAMVEEMQDVNMETVKDLGTTCHSYRPAERDELIDFCFVSKDTVDCIASKRMTETVDGMFPSDHFGVYSEIQVHERVRVMTFNVGGSSSEYSVDEATRASWARSLTRTQQPDVAGLQGFTPDFEEKFRKLEGYAMAMEKGNNPIIWRNDRFDLLEEKYVELSQTLGRSATLVVLQQKGTNEKMAFLNSQLDPSEESQLDAVEGMKELTKDYEMPLFYLGTFQFQIGSKAHVAMKEFSQDFREMAEPMNLVPTFNNLGRLTPPLIQDYLFVKGQGITAETYEVLSGYRAKGGKKGYISDHQPVKICFLLK